MVQVTHAWSSHGINPSGAFNVAVSFVTNTNWQWYSGEVSMSHLSQMLGLTVQNFVSACVGFAIVIAIIRGVTRTNTRMLGNFWVDLTRGTTRILVPLSTFLALALVSQGVVQNLRGGVTARVVDQATGSSEQIIPGGPVASQVAIKQLGTNGGGFFNANSAHPFENPNGLTDLLQLWAILVIPLAVVVAFGRLVGDKRQSKMLVSVMLGFLVMFSTSVRRPCFGAACMEICAWPSSGVSGRRWERAEVRRRHK